MSEIKANILNFSKLCTGCTVGGGALTPAYVPAMVQSDNCPQNVIFAAYAQKPNKILLVADKVYFSFGDTDFNESDSGFAPQRPFLFDAQNAESEAYLGDSGACLLIRPVGHRQEQFKQGIFGGVIKNGRLFAQDVEDGFKIHWSGEGGGLDWTDGIYCAGFAVINPEKGKILNLAVFNDEIVLLCENGIICMAAYGTPENFKLRYIDGAIGKIYPNTAAAVQDMLVFLTDGGLCGFDGNSVKQLEIPLFESAENPVCAAAEGGHYFLSAFYPKLNKNVIFCADTENRSGYLADCSAEAFYFKDGVHAVAGGEIYALKRGGEFLFESGDIDFGTKGRKLLNSVFIDSDVPVDVEVKSGGKSRIFKGVSGLFKPKMSGFSFKFIIKGHKKIRGAEAAAEVIYGV